MADRSRYTVSFRVTCAWTLYPFTSFLIVVGYNQILFSYAFRQSTRVYIPPVKGYRWVKGSPIRTEVVSKPDDMSILRWVRWALINSYLQTFQSLTIFIQGNGALGDDNGKHAVLRGGFYRFQYFAITINKIACLYA